MQTTLFRRHSLSGFQLKGLAVISMLIDHFGSIVMDGVLSPYRQNGFIQFTADMPFFVRNAYPIKGVCDALGSVAFPIFCFLAVEGFLHTRSKLRYAGSLGVFALLSEIPFDLAHYGRPVNFALQNVLFTLCVGVLTLWALSRAERQKRAGAVCLSALAILLGCGLSFLLRSEYVFLGVSAISFTYLLRGTKWQLAGLAPLLVASPWVLLAAAPLLAYRGERGRGSKYFFYVFYPAHFLLFYGIACLLARR